MENIRICDFEGQYGNAFRQLNEEWITHYFVLEEADRKALNHPEEYILSGGGAILIALMDNKPVGTCALIREKQGIYELAKMAVTPAAQGKGIGYLLGRACIEKARSLGAVRIFLESNTRLTPALNLYLKMGFREVPKIPSPYERCNIRMELSLEN